MDRTSISRHGAHRQQRSWRLVHERHELIRKARHRTPDADAAYIRTSANPRHPTSFPHVALHHWTPAPQLHDASARTIFLREFRLLVVSAAIAAFVYRLSKKPGR